MVYKLFFNLMAFTGSSFTISFEIYRFFSFFDRHFIRLVVVGFIFYLIYY